MAKVKYWVLAGVDKVVKGTYKMADKVTHKSNYVQAEDGTIYYISGANKGYDKLEEAEAALGNSVPTTKKVPKSEQVSKRPTAKPSLNLTQGSYIGSDEVGKVEPLKQLIVVAVHVKADKFEKMRELGVDDSKKIPSKIKMIGKTLTGFEIFEEFESGKVYENEEYGLTYCPIILSNADYNKYHNAGVNANEVLTKIHNDANLKLLQYIEKSGQKINDVIIDDYMNGYGDKKFKEYLDRDKFDSEKITDCPELNISFEVKADGTYKEIVGTASDICAYLDGLWQEHLNTKYDMDLDYGNNIKAGNLRASFNRISEVDSEMLDVKHTKTYEDWAQGI